MFKNSLKKLVSFVSAAAMLGSLAVPAVYADETEAEDMGSLFASGDILMSNDFNDLDTGALIYYQDKEQPPYTALEAVDLYVGSGTVTGNEGTGAFIEDGVGVGGSKALSLVSSKRAQGSFGARMSFKLPPMDDKYVITFKAYPTAKQDVYLNDSAESNTATKALGLNKDEWNDIEIYVSRSGSTVGRLVNVNGVTNKELSDGTGAAPVVWGTQANNAGALYIDDVEIKVSTVLPTPIPTPSPEPVRQLGLGDGNDFEEYTQGTEINHVLTTEQEPSDAIAGFVVYIGNRTGGESKNTRSYIAAGKDGNGLAISNGDFYSAGRGPRIQLITPQVDENVNYKVSFDAVKRDDGNDLYLASSTSSNDGTAAGLTTDVWSKVEIYMAGGQQIIFVDGRFIKVSSTTSLPVLWGADINRIGDIVIDNYMIEEAADEEVINAIAASVDITNEDKTVYFGQDSGYKFISGFTVPDVIIGRNVSWDAFELSNDEWIPTSDLKVSGTNVVLNGATDEKQYKLIATVTDGESTASKEFIIDYVKTEDVVKTVIDNLELPKQNILYENDVYSVTGNFSVPLTEWVTDIAWTVTDPSSIQIDNDGDVKVFPKNTNPITLTATVSYKDESMTKDFPISLLKAYREKLHIVEDELVSTLLYPKGPDGESVTSTVLSADGETTLSYDVSFKKISANDANLAIEWESSDESVLTQDGVISVTDKEKHPVTLTKTVIYTMEGQQIVEASADYAVNVQFNPDTMQAEINEIVREYAASKNADENSAAYQAAYNNAMEMLSDRYKTRGDAAYEKNFKDIPSSADDDFTLPTEGYFGSTITWGSSNTAIKITGEKAKVTQPSKDTDVKLTATFTSGAATNAKAYTATVSVEGTGKSSGSSGGSSGGGNSYRGSLGTSMYTDPITATPIPSQPEVPKGEFTDLGSVAWAEVAINSLAKQGIVTGRDAVTFAPNDDITRAEFAKILTGAFEIELGAAADFTDVAEGEWYAPYVGACYAAGIITGYDDGSFKPNNCVTRQEMAVMVMRAAQYKGMTIEKPYEKVDFTDADEIASYAADAVDTLQQAGIINGMADGSFAPTATATRAQAAKILYTFCQE